MQAIVDHRGFYQYNKHADDDDDGKLTYEKNQFLIFTHDGKKMLTALFKFFFIHRSNVMVGNALLMRSS